ncbi:fatty acid desaturase [Seonamhaeicola marinus]|uniref:Fatty acid desaturase n=1 Tax=Seonamhaeicola marinus TaxID=1912246 RepID=A0A5D0HJT7_9FLAO|nr:fatty acid desaturase [Seonamhaeicola marinus]TYA71505.1 fatty acid desaturase [Seonamhaeicola marinus]
MATRKLVYTAIDPYGIFIAIVMILSWLTSLLFLLQWHLNYTALVLYLGILLQTHLFTGLFITAHDAMHGTVSSNKILNDTIGWITSLLFAFNFYDRLLVKHHEHHRHVASDKDPDYHESGKLLIWYYNFIKKYTTIKQLVLMTISLQLLRLIFPLENLLLFWILPSILSTFQLFYFGTYIPHKDGHSHNNKHNSGSLKKNHVLAFFTCYFFGYHYEHHDAPHVPWWRLWRTK